MARFFASRACPPNVWLGVSVEDQREGMPRIEHLRSIGTAVRFLSVEPLHKARSMAVASAENVRPSSRGSRSSSSSGVPGVPTASDATRRRTVDSWPVDSGISSPSPSSAQFAENASAHTARKIYRRFAGVGDDEKQCVERRPFCCSQKTRLANVGEAQFQAVRDKSQNVLIAGLGSTVSRSSNTYPLKTPSPVPT